MIKPPTDLSHVDQITSYHPMPVKGVPTVHRPSSRSLSEPPRPSRGLRGRPVRDQRLWDGLQRVRGDRRGEPAWFLITSAGAKRGFLMVPRRVHPFSIAVAKGTQHQTDEVTSGMSGQPPIES